MQHPPNTETHTKEILNWHSDLLKKTQLFLSSLIVPIFSIVKNQEKLPFSLYVQLFKTFFMFTHLVV